MEDRTADLLRARKSQRPDEEEPRHSASAIKAEGLQGEVAGITTLLNKVKDNTELLAKSTQQKKFDGLQRVIEDTNAMLFELRGKLSVMAKGTKDEIRTNQLKRLTEQFKEAGRKYQETQESYKESLLDSVTSEARIVSPNITRGEVKRLIDEGKDSSFFADKLLGAAHARAKDEYRFITGWFQDLKKLEESMAALHGLFLDVSLHVETQQEKLDIIEQDIDVADADAAKAVEHLTTAAAHASNKRSRRACCCCALGTATTVAAGGAGAAAYLNGCTIM